VWLPRRSSGNGMYAPRGFYGKVHEGRTNTPSDRDIVAFWVGVGLSGCLAKARREIDDTSESVSGPRLRQRAHRHRADVRLLWLRIGPLAGGTGSAPVGWHSRAATRAEVGTTTQFRGHGSSRRELGAGPARRSRLCRMPLGGPQACPLPMASVARIRSVQTRALTWWCRNDYCR
jgi:hypothetical protein